MMKSSSHWVYATFSPPSLGVKLLSECRLPGIMNKEHSYTDGLVPLLLSTLNTPSTAADGCHHCSGNSGLELLQLM